MKANRVIKWYDDKTLKHMKPIMIWGKNRKSGWHINKIRQYQGEKRRFVSKFTSQEMKSTAYWLTTCPTHLCKLSSNGYLDTFTETPCFLKTKTQIHIKTDSETAGRHETLECEGRLKTTLRWGAYSTPQEIYTMLMFCCVLLWFGTDWFYIYPSCLFH